MPSYKLYYFNAKGVAEMSRILFAAAGQEFEDIRVEREEWSKLKETMPCGQIPVLEIDGKKYSQSVAIVLYLAKEFGFYGKSNIDGLVIDGVFGMLGDFIQVARKHLFETDEAKKTELQKAFTDEVSPKFFDNLENMLKENGTGYIVGDKISVADIAIFDMYTGFLAKNLCSVDKYPLLKSLMDRVGNQDKIKAYMAKRPETPF